jgi:hypothetical protein
MPKSTVRMGLRGLEENNEKNVSFCLSRCANPLHLAYSAFSQRLNGKQVTSTVISVVVLINRNSDGSFVQLLRLERCRF